MTRASFWRPFDTCSHNAPPSLYMPGLVTPRTLMAESLLIVWFISVYPPFGMVSAKAFTFETTHIPTHPSCVDLGRF